MSERILNSLEKAGKDITALSIDDLAPMEEFHIGGRKATHHLASLSGLSNGMRVLDIGCGVGGPARALARMADKISLLNSGALDMPFANDAFDVAWMQHAAVNISDKEKLFRQIARILRPKGKLAMYELFKGDLPVKYFPLPWAQKPDMSYLTNDTDAQNLLKSIAFSTTTWEDVTLGATEFFRKALSKTAKQRTPSVNLSTLMGPSFPVMAQNVLKNLEENRLSVIYSVFSLDSF
ncbi:MAG: methyltransferase domain-containing protein [Deltaproteobacteria bacterium]|nr:methyltransferase domain-containing protein [Deltaproteobacteria bacterium]